MAQRGSEPRIVRRCRDEITGSTKGSRGGWEIDIQDRQQAIRTAYLTLAEQLERGTAEELHLASDVRSFVAGMPIPLTRQQLLNSELRLTREKASLSPPHRQAPPAPTQHQPSLSSQPSPRVFLSRTPG